jgi:signal transduction histidine kinase
VEDTSNSGIKKGKRQLKVHFPKHGGYRDLIDQFKINLDLYPSLKPTSSSHLASLFVDQENSQYNFTNTLKLIDQETVRLPQKQENLTSFLKLFENSLSVEDNAAWRKKQVRDLIKLTKKNKSPMKKVNSLFRDNLPTSGAINLIQSREELDKLFIKLESLESLTKSLIENNVFSSYESCQLLIHERGKPVIDNFIYDTEGVSSSSSLPATNFNSIYNLIKKSKSKLFNQSNILKDDLGVVGTFHAKEIDLKNHIIIVIISRNAFLMPTEHEISYFNEIIELLSPLLEDLLLKEKSLKKLKNIRLALDNFPFPISIVNKSQNIIIFENQFKKNDPSEDFRHDNFNINSELELEVGRPDLSTNSSDIYHHQRVSLLGELLNTLQHELSNPLFGLKLSADLLKYDVEDPEVTETLDEVADNALRCQTIIKNFSYLYNDETSGTKVNLLNLIKETLTLTKSASRQIPKTIKTIGCNSEDDFSITINPTWISQILFNLVINSAQAITSHSLENISSNSIEILLEKSQKYINISVKDSGPGIPEDLASQIAQPFFTTKDQGTGLGLSICHSLAKKLGGELRFNNNNNCDGTTFTLQLPYSGCIN